MIDDAAPPAPAEAPPHSGVTLRWIGRVAWVRLRFLIVLGAAFGAVAGWDYLQNIWGAITRGPSRPAAGSQVVSDGAEYFCPMDPGVVGDWPGKCPICNMALVRRARGDATPLPEGVLARMQLSPYRLQLGGIASEPVAYRPLARLVEAPGRVRSAASDADDSAEVGLSVPRADLPGIAPGLGADVLGATSPRPLRAVVRLIAEGDIPGEATLLLAAPDPERLLAPGAPVRGRLSVPMAAVEPFRSQAELPPLRPDERRRVYVCPEHADVVRVGAGRCPQDDAALIRRDLAEAERLRWWCPMHPDVTADVPGGECAACGGMELVPRIVRYGPPGQVLAVPEGAVIDTGRRKLVYVERMPGMFDGVEVVLGPRCGAFYPVVRGLEAGRRVVAAGAFLVDAETRLNPGVATGYFGASGRGPAAPADAPPAATVAASALPAEAARQKACPVTGKPLGSMGAPVRLEVAGRSLFICCAGCEAKLRADPDRYLARLPAPP